jgi:hypothetical protein
MSVAPRFTLEKIETLLKEHTHTDDGYDLHRACEQLLTLVRYSVRAWRWGDAPADLKTEFSTKTELQPREDAILVHVPTGVVDPFTNSVFRHTDLVMVPDGVIYVAVS